MKILIYSSRRYEEKFLSSANKQKHELSFVDMQLSPHTVHLSRGFDAISVFVNDNVSAPIVEELHKIGVKYILLRSAGFNHVDHEKAKSFGMRVARVPVYSPYAVAEHAITLMLSLNRNIIRSHNRVMDLNFSLDGLTGFDMKGKTVGVIGTGTIGAVLCKILTGFGCNILAHDLNPAEELIEQLKVRYVSLETLWTESDIISLHCPLTEKTKYLIRNETISLMKPGVMLINTSRGGLVNTKHVINALKSGKIGYLGMDVYEEEEHLFFADHSGEILQDELIARLLTFRNVLITGHQAFLTKEAIENIAGTTIFNADCFDKQEQCTNEI